MDVKDVFLLSQEELGRGHLRLLRVHLRNQYADGSLSAPHFCELVDRPAHGTDAVVVGLWRRNSANQDIEVLLRRDSVQRSVLVEIRPGWRFPIGPLSAFV